MAEPRYHDFDVRVEAIGEGRYRVRVLDSPVGEAREEFELPFSSLELENFLLRIGRPRRGVRRLESPEAEAAREFGRRLAEGLLAGEVGVAWQRSVDEAERGERGLRLRLRLGDAPDLAGIPWEYLYLPTEERHLVLSTWTPLVRYLDLPHPARPLTVDPPLRLLAMVSDPTDQPVLDTATEWAKLDESLGPLEDAGLVEVTRLERATLRELQRSLRRHDYHVFHFIGHGGYDVQAGDGILVLEAGDGRARQVTGREVATILHDARSIRLAVLNTCEGARSSVIDPFAGTATSLVAGGIPAVVAMQFEITDRAAIVFAHELYTAVADGYPIDAAVTEARRAIYGTGNDVEWGTPVLYLRTDDGRLFDIAPAAEPRSVTRDNAIRVESDDKSEGAPAEPAESPVAAEPRFVTNNDAIRVESGDKSEGAPAVPVQPAEPGAPTVAARPRWVAAGLTGVAVIAFVIVLAVRNGAPPATTTPVTTAPVATAAPVTTVAPVTTAAPPVTTAPFRVVDEASVVAVPKPPGLVIDGGLEDWSPVRTVYLLGHVVYNHPSGVRSGQDSPGIVRVAYDEGGLYMAAEVDDDHYAQGNDGDQIWRGDAVNLNLSTAPPEEASATPDLDDFQLTMTPFNFSGFISHVWFKGVPGAATFLTGELDRPVTLAADFVDPDDAYVLEAFIPWRVFELEGPPDHDLTALFALFDNDGEEVEGRPIQRTILANVPGAEFQQPHTWGRLSFEPS